MTASDASAFDEGRVAERLALAARACGLGSCIATLKNEGPDAAKALLGIPPERRARTLVTIGHTDVEARRALPKAPQARKPMSEFAHWDRALAYGKYGGAWKEYNKCLPHAFELGERPPS